VAGERELARLEARRKKLVKSITEGVPGSEVKERAARREELHRQHAAISEPKPLLHPEMATIYRTKVTELAKARQEPDSRSEATVVLRGPVDAIVLTPDQGGEALQIELRGNLAAMLEAAGQTRRSSDFDELPLQVSDPRHR
jgi:site-specific DNA recombinase